MKNIVRYKQIYTVIAGIIIILIYYIIFNFSSATGEISGEFSRGIVAEIIDAIERVLPINLPFNDSIEQIETMNYYIRKTGHFLEYATLGFFIYSIALCWNKGNKKSVISTVFLIVLLAALDEFHQYFVPGRYGKVTDVFIDTGGGIAGMIIIALMVKLFSKRKM